ncbi:MAG: tetratricopeptide repeat protein [Kiritimatiellia bacterium]
MSISQELRAQLLRRLSVVLPLLTLGWWLLSRESSGAILRLLGGVFLVLAGILLVGPLMGLFAEPIVALFHPSDYYDKPQPIFSIPEAYRKQRRLEEAWEAYEMLLEEHPYDVRAYVAMLELAMHEMKHRVRAETTLRRALFMLKEQKDREAVLRLYEVLKSEMSRCEAREATDTCAPAVAEQRDIDPRAKASDV